MLVQVYDHLDSAVARLSRLKTQYRGRDHTGDRHVQQPHDSDEGLVHLQLPAEVRPAIQREALAETPSK